MPADPMHARDWEEMARLDPLWAILSAPEKRYGKWDLREFLRTGEEEIAVLIAKAREMGLLLQSRHAVDFGCGVGRLTRALRPYFTQCHGVDISARMLEMAAQLTPECDFRQGNDLSSFEDCSADFIYSNLVLQHQPSRRDAANLIWDMVRALAPGGFLAFQIPVDMPLRNRIQPRRRVYRLLRALGIGDATAYRKLKLSPIRMIWIPRFEVEEIIKSAGGKVVRVDEAPHPGEPFTSGLFYVTRDS
jgi:SAM-dependent methyltransferase